jgi:hypothetical protein
MPGILIISMTERTPDIELNEANSVDKLNLPTPYKLEFAIKTSNPEEKLKILYKILELNSKRINPKHKFFKVSIEEVKLLFDLIDGELWSPPVNPVNNRGKMSERFSNGQIIRHSIGKNDRWKGVYDSVKNVIIRNSIEYGSPSAFTKAHYKMSKPNRTPESNGWTECKSKVNGVWISIDQL